MKFVLVAVNLLLALWLLASVGSRFSRGSSGKEEFSVKKRESGGKAAGPVGVAVKKAPVESIDSLLATIIDNNIFNPDRCPNAVFGRGRSARVELSLVGTFEIGTCKGAIILQKTSANDRNNFRNMMMGGMMGGPGGEMGGPPGMPDQQQGSSQRSASSRQGAGRTRFSGMGTRNNGNTSGAAADSTATASVKQYVRVGETLSNGYTLSEVTRTSATLTRGSDKMELELQDPSKNQTKAAATTNTRRNPFLDQLQQMQQMQMMQNFQMMRMMRDSSRNQNQNQGGNRGGSSSGNTRGGGGGGPGGPPPGM